MEIQIPKQSDATLVASFSEICSGLNPGGDFYLKVTPHPNAPAQLDVEMRGATAFTPIKYILDEDSEIIPFYQLYDRSQTGHLVLELRRTTEITDVVQLHWVQWGNIVGSAKFVKLMALVRKHLRAASVSATLDAKGEGVDRYIDSQRVLLSSLEETAKTVLVDANRHRMALENELRTRYERLEEQLRTEHKEAEAKFAEERSRQTKILEEREATIKKREESFETKEARYVARAEQEKQIEQIKSWLEKWSLTEATQKKRWPVVAAGGIGAAVAASFTYLFSQQSVLVLQGKNLAEISWWQWGLLMLKPALAFIALTTVVIYFIRWTSAWAAQHADEEFRNRARVLDIGRSKWILEAVRDAQDNNKEFPPELMKELSRNLFAGTESLRDSGESKHSGRDLGLGLLRLKTSDGTELEAKRARGS